MILEAVILDVKPGREADYERDFALASRQIRAIDGYVAHELHRCLERTGRYLLLVHWESLEAHTETFRNSAEYVEWKRLLHPYYDPFPNVEHYEVVYK